jgi:hypothetical protein
MVQSRAEIRRNLSAGNLTVVALVVGLSAACSSTAIESDKSYVEFLQNNKEKFNAVVDLARKRNINYETVDLRVERDKTENSKATRGVIGKNFPAKLVEFRATYIKLYFQIDGFVGVTSTFKGFIYYYDRHGCDSFAEETSERVAKMSGDASDGEFSVLKTIDDKWCIFYSLDVD